MEIEDSTIVTVLTDLRSEMQRLTESLDKRLVEIEKELHGYRFFVKVMKYLIAFAAAVLTFRWGDIRHIG